MDQTMKRKAKLIEVVLFAIAFAFVESAVVTYLRAIYYPEGFSFPLRMLGTSHVLVELTREFATIVMLVSVGMLAGSTRWQKFSYFMIAFGVWDIFYYVWLKVTLNWPSTLFDWDILFLIPTPWIGPVIAPVLISIVMIAAGVLVIRKEERDGEFRPPLSAWLISGLGSLVMLFTFMRDTDATLYSQLPQPYLYGLFVPALLLTIFAMVLAFKSR
jgi:hypothetical protein